MDQFYNMIFRRKSVRRYDAARSVSETELAEIHSALGKLRPLLDIPVAFRIVKREETTCMWGEYCLMAYSADGEGSLLNIGYMLEQMDLFLTGMDIGTCWYGFGKPKDEQSYDGKDFIIMMAFGKCRPEKLRQAGAKIRRKALPVICEEVEDPVLRDVIQTAHYAPSACNSQPWRVKCKGDLLCVSRTRGIQSRFAEGLTGYMNKIDMGIFLLFLEMALTHEKIAFQREIPVEDLTQEPVRVAVYHLKRE